MPDFSMCLGKGCDRKYECRRYRAVPSKWQSFIAPEAKNCPWFWAESTKPKTKLRNESQSTGEK